MLLKVLGILIALGASLFGIFSTFSLFAPSEGVDLHTASTAPVVLQHGPWFGSSIILVACLALAVSFYALNQPRLKKPFFILIVCGAVLIALHTAVAGSLMMAGAVMGLIGSTVKPIER